MRIRLLLFMTLAMVWSASAASAVLTAEQERHDVETWRAQRLANLTGPTGWLSLVGLYWLNEGANSFGRDAKNSIVLDHPALGPRVGTFVMKRGKVQFIAKPGSGVTHDGAEVSTIDMVPDSRGDPTILSVGSIQFFVIERAGKLGVRVRDQEHTARKHFKGLDSFPIRLDWVVDARFEPYTPERRIPIVNILGMKEDMQSPGAVVFERDGRTWRLDTIRESPEDRELFIMFADATSGHETYGAGRFLYIPEPANGRAVVDFNKAYNPPCAFNDFATCPLPPRENRIELNVDAGERKYSRF